MRTRAGTLLWVYCQYIEMPYIALARQAWIYRDISESLGTLLWIRNELWSVLQYMTVCTTLQCSSVIDPKIIVNVLSCIGCKLPHLGNICQLEGFRDAYASKITWKEVKMAILNSSVVQNLEIISTVIVYYWERGELVMCLLLRRRGGGELVRSLFCLEKTDIWPGNSQWVLG